MAKSIIALFRNISRSFDLSRAVIGRKAGTGNSGFLNLHPGRVRAKRNSHMFTIELCTAFQEGLKSLSLGFEEHLEGGDVHLCNCGGLLSGSQPGHLTAVNMKVEAQNGTETYFCAMLRWKLLELEIKHGQSIIDRLRKV
jgi:hypothetical protein